MKTFGSDGQFYYKGTAACKTLWRYRDQKDFDYSELEKLLLDLVFAIYNVQSFDHFPTPNRPVGVFLGVVELRLNAIIFQ